MREKIKMLVENAVFTTAIFVLIVLNSLTLGIETFNVSDSVLHTLGVFNTVCIIIFVLEIVLKLYAYGINFFKDAWNIFDILIVLVSILPMVSFLSSMRSLRIFRMFRALRALRIMQRLDKLRVIVQALLRALPSVAWVVMLLFIIYYVFAVIGTNLFATVSPEYFGSLGKTAYTLFQITMADDIGDISRPLLSQGISVVIYFVSFVALSSILVLNVIVGIVVDSVAEIKKGNKSVEEVLPQELKTLELKIESAENVNKDLLKEIQNLEHQLERVKRVIVVSEQNESN